MASQTRLSVSVWEIRTSRKAITIETAASEVEGGHKARLTSAASSPDERYILTGSADGTAKLWNIATGHLVRSFP